MISKEALQFKDKAICLSMCSEAECYNRFEVEKGSLSNFEMSKQRPPSDLCIKRFQRPAADKVLNTPSEVRPPIVIYHVVKYLRDCIADQDRYPPNESYYKYSS